MSNGDAPRYAGLPLAAAASHSSEEFDTTTGRHLGNFPQAFSHLALIEAAAAIIVAEAVRDHTS